jgi:hypothetical protein
MVLMEAAELASKEDEAKYKGLAVNHRERFILGQDV